MRVMRRSSLHTAFLVVLLCTEMFHVQAFGGLLRPYHFLLPWVILTQFRWLPRVTGTWVFRMLAAFLLANLFAALAASEPQEALRSLGLLVANMSIALAVALMLTSGKLTALRLVRVTLMVALVGSLVGIAQMLLWRFAGVDLTLGPTHAGQVRGGFAWGFRTAANGVAEFLNAAFRLVLPFLLRDRRPGRARPIFAVLVAGMRASPTRSALYGLAVTLGFAWFWYRYRGRGSIVAWRPAALAALAALAVALVFPFAAEINPYAFHKLTTFFDLREIIEGDSGGFRLMSQGLLWDAFLQSDKTVAIGNGWGQVRFSFTDRQMQAGGAELVMALGYGGLVAGAFYAAWQVAALRAANRLSRRARGGETPLWGGGPFAPARVARTRQIKGAKIAPPDRVVCRRGAHAGYAARPRAESGGRRTGQVLRAPARAGTGDRQDAYGRTPG